MRRFSFLFWVIGEGLPKASVRIAPLLRRVGSGCATFRGQLHALLATHSQGPHSCTYAAVMYIRTGCCGARLLARSRQAKLSSCLFAVPLNCRAATQATTHPQSPQVQGAQKKSSVRWLRPQAVGRNLPTAPCMPHIHTLAHSPTEHSTGTRSWRADLFVYIRRATFFLRCPCSCATFGM